MRILALDTSTDPPGAALLDDGRLLAARSFASGRPLETGIADLLDGLVASAGGGSERLAPDLGLVAVGLGPGGYTALRIGVAVAKGLALAFGVPLRGIPSTDALAVLGAASVGPAAGEDVDVAVVTDARRGEIGLARYRVRDGRLVSRTGPRLARPEEVLAGDAGPDGTVVVGDAVPLHAEVYAGARALLPPPYPDLPATVGRLAWAEGVARRTGAGTAPATGAEAFDPIYLRAPVNVPPFAPVVRGTP